MAEINTQLLVRKAEQFGFNVQLIEYLINLDVSINQELLQKLQVVVGGLKEIEEQAQVS